MLDHDLPGMLAQVRRLRRRFAETAPARWDATTAAAELTVQLGHASLCLLRRRNTDVGGFEDAARPIDNVGDELADVVLAALSVCVLADAEPATAAAAPPDDLDDLFFLLVVSAGRLAEAAMVSSGHRHLHTGRAPSVPDAAAQLLGICGAIAIQVGVDLPREFAVMVADADGFLDAQGVRP
ncbi:MAG: hypothetical protein GEU97_21210 [Actinophytocola sp.]|nr:hypothetical protein [Actinophytocola sp.]